MTGAIGAALLLGSVLVVGVVTGVAAQPLPVAPAATDVSLALQQARAIVAKTHSSVDSLKAQIGEARKSHDVIKALCLSDNRKQLQAAERSSRERLAALESAASSGQLTRARHEHTMLTALGERVAAIIKQADECIGDEVSRDQGGALVIDVSASVPGVDPSSTVINPFGATLSAAALDPDAISPPPIVATPID